MSRCFPYPPPGYFRNGATYEALIESIKLQKETTKTKADRKKEKKAKKEKREKRQKSKENRKHEVKLQKITNGDSHKMFQKAADYTESIKKTKTISEQFEKSDMTEEYGQPIGQQQPSYSSDSTQNSNKRKRDDSISNGNGYSFKIRLLKKHKDSDCSNVSADVISNSHPSRSENRIQTKSNLIFEESKIGDSNKLHFGRIHSVSRLVKPQLPILRFERKHEIPSSTVSKHVDEQKFDSCRQQQQLVPSTSDVIKRSDHEHLKKVGHTRYEKKMLKKHSKYEKLVGSLFPPVFQANLTPRDDDWLSSRKTSSLTVSNGEVETCRQLVAPWQPCARYLAEVDVHAMPYTVPF